MSRSLLTKRLHELARSGLVVIQPKPDAHGSFYEPTPAGRAAGGVLEAIAVWAENWAEVRPEHSDPGLVLFPWCTPLAAPRPGSPPPAGGPVRVRAERPSHPIVDAARGRRGRDLQLRPGFGDDLVVAIADPLTFTRWHLGLTSWAEALRSGGVQISGPPALRRALPTWNAAPELARRRLAEYQRGQAGCHGVQNYPARLTGNPEAAVFPWGEGAKLSSAGGDDTYGRACRHVT